MVELKKRSHDAVVALGLAERAWPSTDCFGMDRPATCLKCTSGPVTETWAAGEEAEDLRHSDYCTWKLCD